MAEVKFTIDINVESKTIIFKDNGTDYSSINEIDSLDIYFRGEDKTNYIAKFNTTTAGDISAFLSTVGLTILFEDIFGTDLPPDNFYLIEIVVNEGNNDQLLSEKMAFGSTFSIEKVVHRSVLGVHIPIADLYTSLQYGMNTQILEYMRTLSTSASYTYDREVKWRKGFNHLTNSTDDFNY